MKTRLQSLGLLDRSIKAATDDELDAVVTALDDEHRDALTELVPTCDSAGVRESIVRGRLDGTMESVALILTDACLADCIEQLGDHADNPSSDELREVLPGIIERHGVACTRVMLASTVAGEAAASSIIRELLKNDETVKLPPVDEQQIVPPVRPASDEQADGDRAALKARRREQRRQKQAEAQARRAQAEQNRRRK